MSKQRHILIAHLIFLALLPVNHCLNELEVSSRGLLHPAIKVESIATPLLVVPWLHVFEFVSHSFAVIHQKIVERHTECSWFFSEVVRVILNRGNPKPYW